MSPSIRKHSAGDKITMKALILNNKSAEQFFDVEASWRPNGNSTFANIELCSNLKGQALECLELKFADYLLHNDSPFELL